MPVDALAIIEAELKKHLETGHLTEEQFQEYCKLYERAQENVIKKRFAVASEET